MPTLYVMRHAKSRWDEQDVDDVHRGLSPRGLANAPFMGKRLVEMGVTLNLIIASNAVRAEATARMVAEALGNVAVHVDERLYMATPTRVEEVVAEYGQGVESLMVVGHNPTCTSIVERWTNRRVENVPTAGIACISLRKGCDWGDLFRGNHSLVWLLRPKDQA